MDNNVNPPKLVPSGGLYIYIKGGKQKENYWNIQSQMLVVKGAGKHQPKLLHGIPVSVFSTQHSEKGVKGIPVEHGVFIFGSPAATPSKVTHKEGLLHVS